MTVVLSGIGADTTNTYPVPRLRADGFDYLPIPERGRDVTTEETAYSDWYMENEGTTADEYVERIYPRGDDSLCVKGDELADWSFHHDPNFDALTYGERRGAYVNRLRRLGEDDGVFFYTGVRDDDGAMHRYLVGYFVVDGTVYVAGMDGEDARAELRARPDNAHTKRFDATGYVDDNLVVVDGSEGATFDDTRRLSRRAENGHYYLRDSLAQELGCGDLYLGGVKQAHAIDVSVDAFLDATCRLSV